MAYDISNRASYDYLQAFKDIILPDMIDSRDADPVYAPTARFIKSFLPILEQPYTETVDYKDLYHQLHVVVEQIALNPNPNTLPSPYKEFHFDLFKTLYENDSGLHHVIHTKIGISFDSAPAPRSEKIKQNLEREGINKSKFSHMLGELPAMTGIAFDPLKDTNIPYVAFPRLGDYPNEPLILRLGQQTFRKTTQIMGNDKLQPAYLNYLAVKHAELPAKPFHHIYFNLMKRDVEVGETGMKQSITRKVVEGPKTATLESINDMPLGAAIITLPADAPQFLEGFDKHKGRASDPNAQYDLTELKADIINSVLANEHDFYIPDNVRALLGAGFRDDLNALFERAMQLMIADRSATSVNAQQRQAIVFEFVKYQLSRYLIRRLQPDTVNFSCKDAIDRGGVHTLYYEIRSRLEYGLTMDKNEFNTNLDAPALTVHHRPANENRELLFNALRELYLTNSQLFSNPYWGWMSDTLIQNHPDAIRAQTLHGQRTHTTADRDFLNRYHQEIGMIALAATGYPLNTGRQPSSSPTSSSSSSTSSPERASPGRASPGRASPERTSPERTSPERTSPERTSPGRTPPRASPISSSSSSGSLSGSDGEIKTDDVRRTVLYIAKSKKHRPLSPTQVAQLMLQSSIDLSDIENKVNEQTRSVCLIDEDSKLTESYAKELAQAAVRNAEPNTVFDLSKTTIDKDVFKRALIEAVDNEGYGKHLTIEDGSLKRKKRT